MTKYLLLLTFACAVCLTACDDKTETIKEITVSVQITTPDSVTTVPESYQVEFINYNDNSKVEKTAGADGKVTASILPGVYTISVSAEALEQGFSTIYSGSLVNENIVTDGASYTIEVKVAKSGTLVFKEIYYAGSKTPSNASYFRDQFFEIYNNSESVVYADGLCVGTLYTNLASATQPTWDKENAADYVYYQWLWQIPGTGTQYPIQPGEAIIVAQWATNHQVEALNPNAPVNLSSSEFEGYIAASSTQIQTDEQAINLNLIYRMSSFQSMPQWLNSVNGCAYALFFPDGKTDITELTTQEGSTAQGVAIPISLILDAVETVKDETQVQLKRIPTVLDAGATFVSATYNSKSVARKIKETKDGRNIYQDTNNSTNDFEVQDTPTIRRNGAKKPSWNTWSNGN
ncbi:MAG: DUF4876 domain-containing protein [Prevotellaceae bacterium]|jgi:hypothetical protein|nr:DUF4876 domain-containing protein [Prevotellaceae bacterium]